MREGRYSGGNAVWGEVRRVSDQTTRVFQTALDAVATRCQASDAYVVAG
jgi:hypothetical protein